jgi:uncharacterized protein involved in cysteine biosynthesis
MRVVRWILLPIVCIAAWIAALFAGIVADSVAKFLCPAEQIVSGMCVAPWFETLDAWLGRFFSAFAAALIIISCYYTAPAARTVVAWVVFAVGAVYALWIAVVSWAWAEFIAAGVGGVAAVFLLTRGQSILRRISPVAR